MNTELYNYKAGLIRVIDGDTIDIEIDLGFEIKMRKRVRLFGVDTPELRSSNPTERKAAQLVKNVVTDLLDWRSLYVKTVKDKDKYGRYLADIYLSEDDLFGDDFIKDKNGVSLSEWLVCHGWAKEYNKKREVWSDDELENILKLGV